MNRIAALFFRPDNESIEAEETPVDESRFVSMEGSEFLDAVEEFIDSSLILKRDYDNIATDVERECNKVIRNTSCVDELIRDWDGDEEAQAWLSSIKESLHGKKLISSQRHQEKLELEEEIMAARDACTQAIRMLHHLLMDLHKRLPQPDLGETVHPGDLNVVFSTAENDTLMMGIISEVFQRAPCTDIRPDVKLNDDGTTLSDSREHLEDPTPQSSWEYPHVKPRG